MEQTTSEGTDANEQTTARYVDEELITRKRSGTDQSDAHRSSESSLEWDEQADHVPIVMGGECQLEKVIMEESSGPEDEQESTDKAAITDKLSSD